MKIKKASANVYVNESGVEVTTYPFDDADLSLATAKIKERYPSEGYALNKDIKELIYIVEGSGEAKIGEETYTLCPGDALLIPKNTPYYLQGCLSIIMPCAPAWRAEQHHHLESLTQS